ncbi:hypothetical protein JHW43_002598 [Diplocarpon mali]|nr:hypothetical protein JHW43_002598 [Diplocarpon mali]
MLLSSESTPHPEARYKDPEARYHYAGERAREQTSKGRTAAVGKGGARAREGRHLRRGYWNHSIHCTEGRVTVDQTSHSGGIDESPSHANAKHRRVRRCCARGPAASVAIVRTLGRPLSSLPAWTLSTTLTNPTCGKRNPRPRRGPPHHQHSSSALLPVARRPSSVLQFTSVCLPVLLSRWPRPRARRMRVAAVAGVMDALHVGLLGLA